MTVPSEPGPTAPPPSGKPPSTITVDMGDDWPKQVTDSIVDAVNALRDKTAVPLDKAAHWMVYGVMATFLGTVAAVLLAIGLVRLIDVYLPGEVWAAHSVVGGTFLLLGLFLWSRRRR